MLLSRVADALYWISRYLERAEHTARLMDVRLDLGLDRRPTGDGWDFDRLFAALRLEPLAETPTSPAALIDALVFDLDYPDSVLALRHGGARERASGARRDQLGHVGAAQRALPPVEAGAHRGDVVEPAALHLPHGDRRRAPVRGRHRRDDVARRRLAVPAGRPLPRARRRDGGARRPALPRGRRGWPPNARRVGGPAAIVRGARGVLPLLHGAPPARAASPSSCSSIRTFRARCGSRRRASSRRCARSRSSPAGPTTAAPSGSPAGSTPRSTTARWTRSSARIRTPISRRVGRYCAQIHAAAYQSYITYPIESALPA